MVATSTDMAAARREKRRRPTMGRIVALSATLVACTAMVGTATAGAATTTITSVKTTGTPANPTIVVTGTGFGSQPAPNPSFHPEGHEGCPALPRAGNGFNYGDRIYFSDINAARGMSEWTAGQADKVFFDCVGIIIDQWTNHKIVFHFGNAYNKHLPENFYVLSNGDPIRLTVKGTTFKARARF
jgi:hypothetical protein